jgi:hypothetical protein
MIAGEKFTLSCYPKILDDWMTYQDGNNGKNEPERGGKGF